MVPLYAACRFGFFEIVEVLLKWGAQANIQCKTGSDSENEWLMLISQGADRPVLLAACRESEKAYESYHRGIFTQTLLSELRRIKTDKITYQGLMQRVVKPM